MPRGKKGGVKAPSVSPEPTLEAKPDSATELAAAPKPAGKELTLEQRVAAKLKGNFFREPTVFGKAGRFQVPPVYTANGLLSPRWVATQRVEAMRAEGYALPSEVDGTLEDLKNGSLILMLRPTSTKQRHLAATAAKTESRVKSLMTDPAKSGSNFRGDGYTPGR